MDETSKDAVPSMGPPEPKGKLDGQNRATNLQGLSSEGLEGIVKSFGLSCDTCTNAGHWISRVRSGGAHGCDSWRADGVALTPSLLPRSPRDAAAPAQVAPQKARAQVRQMLAARVTRHVTRAPVCTLASLPRDAAGRPHGSWHAHLPIHPSRLTPRGPAHPGTTWTSCSTSAICRSCELSCTFYRSLSLNVSTATRSAALHADNWYVYCYVKYIPFICSFYSTTVAAWKYRDRGAPAAARRFSQRESFSRGVFFRARTVRTSWGD